jgi:uncharacterized iron-regulated membrane protein
MKYLRQLHRKIGVILAPFFIILSLSGISLIFRKTDIYSKDIKEIIESIHTMEIILPFIGAILGFGLLFMSISGLILYFKRR